MQSSPLVTVKIGDRKYATMTTWSRRDEIYLDGVKIGLIKLACDNRAGQTISLTTAKSLPGRQVDWCVEQSQTVKPSCHSAGSQNRTFSRAQARESGR